MRIAHGAAWNLAGHFAPLGAALVAIPFLAARLGPDRFGFLALAWALVGYFSLFDLGIGRTLTRLIANRAQAPHDQTLHEQVRAGLTLSTVLGVAAGGAIGASADWICTALILFPTDVSPDAAAGLRWLAAGLPLMTLGAAQRGILEGERRFDWVNAIRIPVGILTFVAPMIVVANAGGLSWICLSLLVVRLGGVLAQAFACRRQSPSMALPGRVDGRAAKALLVAGSWMTVSNVVGPLMVYSDRFLIGVIASAAAVGYYAAPYEAVTRLWILPAALTGAMFPVLAAAGEAQARAIALRGTLLILASAVPISILAAAAAPWWIGAWLGPDHAQLSSGAARWIAIGVALNCLAYVPLTLLQARGRADLTGRLHLAELPAYLAILVPMTREWGIEGAAIAWAARCGVDALLLFSMASRAGRGVS